MDFTHFDEKGNAIMVDVSSKDTTQRTAIAYGEICVGQEILEKIENHQMKKGDVLSVARIAGIMAVKKTKKVSPAERERIKCCIRLLALSAKPATLPREMVLTFRFTTITSCSTA